MPSVSNAPRRQWLLLAFVASAVILIVVFAVATRWLGLSEAARALLRGDELAVLPSTIDLGECTAADTKEIQFRVVNMSSSPVTLTGVYTSCSCIVVGSLPAIVKAGESFPLHMTVHPSETPGRFTRSAVLYSDSNVSPQLPVEVTGRTLQSDPRSDGKSVQQLRNSGAESASNDKTTATNILGASARVPDLAPEAASH